MSLKLVGHLLEIVLQIVHDPPLKIYSKFFLLSHWPHTEMGWKMVCGKPSFQALNTKYRKLHNDCINRMSRAIVKGANKYYDDWNEL